MQIFPRSLNKLPLIVAGGASFGLVAVVFLMWYYFSPWFTQVGYAPKQPVPYSHRLHVGQLGLDCRYCHVNVERAPLAMVPPTETCMNCHQLVKTDSAELQPIRDSWASGQPMEWARIHKLPDYVYFNHSIHVAKGVGCATCHGPVNKMPLMYEANSLRMEWCLNCHRNTQEYLRPREQVFNMDYVQPSSDNPVKLTDGRIFTDQVALGTALHKDYNVRTLEDITSCSTCHH